MNMFKKTMAAMMLIGAVVFTATAAGAVNVDITISGLEKVDLRAFDLNVQYDQTLLTFDSYTMTDELGSFTVPPDAPDAEDWSLGDNGSGTVNLAALSYLSDFSSQPDAFTLATLSFSGEESAMAAVYLSDIVLSDPLGDPLSFTVNGADITVSVVPLPGAIWLFCTGLGIAGIRRKTKKDN